MSPAPNPGMPLAERLEAAVTRAEELSRRLGRDEAPAGSEPEALLREALLFNLERAAWTVLEIAQERVFALRLGIPRKETEALDLLQRHGDLSLDGARRYKQLCEYRSLSSREPGRIDWRYLTGDLSAELALFRQWNLEASAWSASPSPSGRP